MDNLLGLLHFRGCHVLLHARCDELRRRLNHEGGKRLPYYCSAYSSFYTTIAVAFGLHFTGVFPLYTLIDEFGSIMTVAIPDRTDS